MSPEDAPIGTVVVVGHPANAVTATKQADGRWLTNDMFRQELGYDTLHKGVSVCYTPSHR